RRSRAIDLGRLEPVEGGDQDAEARDAAAGGDVAQTDLLRPGFLGEPAVPKAFGVGGGQLPPAGRAGRAPELAAPSVRDPAVPPAATSHVTRIDGWTGVGHGGPGLAGLRPARGRPSPPSERHPDA